MKNSISLTDSFLKCFGTQDLIFIIKMSGPEIIQISINNQIWILIIFRSDSFVSESILMDQWNVYYYFII